jgi:hypothetical protein
VVLVILAVIWGAVLIPPWLHNRRERQPVRTMASFHRRLDRLAVLEALDRTRPRHGSYAVGMPMDAPDLGVGESAGHTDLDEVDHDDPADPTGAGLHRASRYALRRRRQVFFVLLALVGGSMAAAVVSGTVVGWAVHAATACLFVSYVALLVRHHQRVVEQVDKVRHLSPIRVARPAVVVLRSGTAR